MLVDNPVITSLHPWLVTMHYGKGVTYVDQATCGKYFLLVVTDVFSKWPVHLGSSTSTCTANY